MLTCGAGNMEKNLLLATFKFGKVNVKIDSFRVVRGTKITWHSHIHLRIH